MKKYLPIFLIVALVLAGGFFLLKNKSQSSNQGSVNADIILFVGNGCPHCAKVEEFVKANSIDKKISFITKEIFYNKANAQLLEQKAAFCGLSSASIGVPLLWDGKNSKCYVGDVDVTKFFQDNTK